MTKSRVKVVVVVESDVPEQGATTTVAASGPGAADCTDVPGQGATTTAGDGFSLRRVVDVAALVKYGADVLNVLREWWPS